MSELTQDLLDALDPDEHPGVIIYDPAVGPPTDAGPRGSGRVFLPEIDPMPGGAAENE